MHQNPIEISKLTAIQTAQLEEQNLTTTDFHGVECTCLGLQVADVANVKDKATGKTNPMLVLVAQVMVPIDPQILTKSVLVDANQQNQIFQELLRKSIPVAPRLQFVLKEESMIKDYIPMSEEKKQELEDILAQFKLSPEQEA